MDANRERLTEYRVRARNISADSENKIHDDRVAAEYGFGGGLVPGVAIYAYMTVPIVARFGLDWLERGAISVRFKRPFYEGGQVVVRAETYTENGVARIDVNAVREDGEVCATAIASVPQESSQDRNTGSVDEHFHLSPMPAPEQRLAPHRESLVPGTVLGTLAETLDLINHQQTVLSAIEEGLPCYFGLNAVAHPIVTLSLANHILMQNVELGPWIHSSSDVVNYGVARDRDVVSVRGRIAECFERNGHEFVVLHLLLSVDDAPVSSVCHTAIYKIKKEGASA